MKKKITFSVLLLSLLVLGACGETTPSGSLSDPSSNDTSSTSTSEPSTSSTSEEIEISDISSLRALAAGQEATVRGVVVNHNYSGQSTPYIVGFWMADLTGSVYVYGETFAQAVSKGNTVTLTGTKAYYIPENDVSSAAAVGYIGMQQLINPELVELIDTVSAITEESFQYTTVAAINDIPLTEDITGNIYCVKGRYRRYDETSYVNYGIDDLNRVDSLLAYTQSNGKDYYWTDEFENHTVEMLIIITLGKPAVGLWRMNPVAFVDD
ncbi:MAG: hypothetical protein EOM77_03645, partial [Bacteroidia bacterium]|nr:hypothetical protein [Bacteroidia bacterium]